ncbi:hypothetical protein ACI7RC_18890 [Brevibacillus sp. B_LB10_24]|uniref:hypothetical protein n=1 Tax=Brevibacillus sp. B_LB10_24 TaxID=3380645 RepID=UPI0038BD2A2D
MSDHEPKIRDSLYTGAVPDSVVLDAISADNPNPAASSDAELFRGKQQTVSD